MNSGHSTNCRVSFNLNVMKAMAWRAGQVRYIAASPRQLWLNQGRLLAGKDKLAVLLIGQEALVSKIMAERIQGCSYITMSLDGWTAEALPSVYGSNLMLDEDGVRTDIVYDVLDLSGDRHTGEFNSIPKVACLISLLDMFLAFCDRRRFHSTFHGLSGDRCC